MTKPEKEPSDKVGKVSLKPTDRLEELLKLMDEEDLQELEVSDGPFEVKLVRSFRSGQPSSFSSQEKIAEPVETGTPIKSPLGGVFYRAPSPQAAPFVKEGDVITPGKTLCIVEAMKVLNEINAGVSGRIVKILVENGKPVQTGQTLFVVEPT